MRASLKTWLAALTVLATAGAAPDRVPGHAGAEDGGFVGARHPGAPVPLPWGLVGHEMAARGAHATLPSAMPDFFRAARDQLVYLDPEPDRWRNGRLPEMDQAWSYDHYIDLENVPEGALGAPDRFVFLAALYEAGLEKPERNVGFLPFRIVELYQRLTTEWGLWRAESDPARRGWIEQRILNDAGILGHYVTDASQPHHTTIHFNGWSPGAPNPEGYNEDRTFHARFESGYVDAHVTQADVDRYTERRPRSVAGSARAAVMEHLQATFAEVEELYRLDRDVGFDPDGPLRPEARDFAAQRLGAGASMLAVLWRSAWEESGR